jgi:hypothetical protein
MPEVRYRHDKRVVSNSIERRTRSCQEETEQDRRVKGREQGEEKGPVEEKARSGQGVNPDKAGGRARDKVKAAKAVSAEEETNKDKNFFKKGEWSCH